MQRRKKRRDFLLGGLSVSLTGSLASLAGCTFNSSPLVHYAPSMWRAVSPNGAVEYRILGSVHHGNWRFYPLPKAIEHSFYTSHGLLVELEVGRRYQELVNRFAPLVRQPVGFKLEYEIGEEAMARLRRVLRADHAHTQRLQNLRPWAVVLELQSPVDLRLATEPRQGLDAYFTEQAHRRRIPVLELETVDEQVHALSGGNPAEQLAVLEASMSEVEAWDGVMDTIIDAWRSGDDLRMAQLREKHFPSQGVRSSYRQRMFTTRDGTMAQRIAEHSRLFAPGNDSAAKPFFVLIGAMHLVGDHNVLVELERLGFSLTRIITKETA